MTQLSTRSFFIADEGRIIIIPHEMESTADKFSKIYDGITGEFVKTGWIRVQEDSIRISTNCSSISKSFVTPPTTCQAKTRKGKQDQRGS